MAILNNSNAISSGGYDINNSLRLRASASAYLNRTPASAGNRRIWTWSGWVKRGSLTSFQNIFSAQYISAGSSDAIRFSTTDTLALFLNDGTSAQIVTTQVFRDPSAWYHIVAAVDTTQATSSNRLKLYVNGSQITAFGTATYPSLNFDCGVNNNVPHSIGNYITSPSQYLDGYLAEVNFIDGQALTPSSFGETDTTTGSWKPKAYSGTFGTNGYYLKFSDIATTSGSNAGLGKDFSGNTNYWTTNNISVTAGTTYDAMIDVPTLTSATVANYAVMNPLGNAVGNAPATLSEGNLTCKNTATSYLGALGTIGLPTSGKFYWEVQLTQNSGPSNLSVFGIAPSNIPLTGNQANYANSISWYLGNNTIIQLPSTGTITAVSGGSTTSDVFQICYDGSTGKVYLGRNNTFYNSAGSATGNPSSGTNETTTLTTGDLLPWFFAYQEGATFNFGQRPFSYTPPTGFVALNTYNLPDSTIKKGNTVMDAYIYTGDGNSTRTITLPIVADFVWSKNRTTANDHVLIDTVRGGTSPVKALFSNLTVAEITTTAGWGGYGYPDSLSGTSYAVVKGTQATSYTNKLNDSYVNWIWQAGQGSTSSNTSGSITSTVSVNTTAGFSVVTYTGTGSNATVGHGLGVAPSMMIIKQRNSTQSWSVYHASLGATKRLYLDLTDAVETTTTAWNSTTPTSSVYSVGTSAATNGNGNTFVAYCWAEIAGFSKFTSYTGNGSADGPFIYLGFRPKYVIIKCTNDISHWTVEDSSRSSYNVATASFYTDTSGAESTSIMSLDFLSNGFKCRNVLANESNVSGYTYIVAAWAENPFKNSNAR